MNQEEFWAGQFGDEYTSRVVGQRIIESNIQFFADALVKAKGIKSILELGCNRGLNLAALEYLDPSTVKTGVDINTKALRAMSLMFDDFHLDQPNSFCASAANFDTDERFDLVFTKGLLIHINPAQLESVYDKMYRLSSKYILIAEYYNPSPIEVPYRGYSGKLFKRDFAGEMIDRLGLKLVDYGFVYHRGEYPQDDINWFLLSKE